MALSLHVTFFKESFKWAAKWRASVLGAFDLVTLEWSSRVLPVEFAT